MITYTKELGEDVAQRGKTRYAESIRAKVETPENIGKMLIIDVDTGEYAIDDRGVEASQRLHAKRPDALLYGLRIGYDTVNAIGSVLERTA